MKNSDIHVELGERSYPIIIKENLLENTALLLKYLNYKQLLFVTNETIAPLYLPKLEAIANTKKTAALILPDGEHYKTLASFEKIIDTLMQNQFDRGAALCALGGGVIGDLTGFAAACYRRGIDFIQIPTTLLAQVDAAIGGKTAVNHPLGKNMIGSIYQPKAVLIDINTLKTLPEREYHAGLAEVIKYGLIKDRAFFYWLIKNANAINARHSGSLIPMITTCCAIKANIVASDEHETSERAILNFGHTFGHAIEAATQYKTWLHGEAVAIGMVAASYISLKMDFISDAEFADIIYLLQHFKLPLALSTPLKAITLKNFMAQDKKIINAALKVILLNSLGQAMVTENCSESLIDEALNYIGTAT